MLIYMLLNLYLLRSTLSKNTLPFLAPNAHVKTWIGIGPLSFVQFVQFVIFSNLVI